MFKDVSGRLVLAMASIALMCIGLGAVLFTQTTGIFLLILGFAVGYWWYRKYGKAAPKKSEAPPTTSTKKSTALPATPIIKKREPLDKMDRR